MGGMTELMFKTKVFEQKYKGIVEIHPRKAMNYVFYEAALEELAKTHDIVKITSNWLRAFKREG